MQGDLFAIRANHSIDLEDFDLQKVKFALPLTRRLAGLSEAGR